MSYHIGTNCHETFRAQFKDALFDLLEGRFTRTFCLWWLRDGKNLEMHVPLYCNCYRNIYNNVIMLISLNIPDHPDKFLITHLMEGRQAVYYYLYSSNIFHSSISPAVTDNKGTPVHVVIHFFPAIGLTIFLHLNDMLLYMLQYSLDILF